MSKLDLLKFLESYEGEVEIADFTPEELQDMLDSLDGNDLPMSVEEFKRRYYEYHDDVKDPTLKKQDW